jgi:hypothetical protein
MLGRLLRVVPVTRDTRRHELFELVALAERLRDRPAERREVRRRNERDVDQRCDPAVVRVERLARAAVARHQRRRDVARETVAEVGQELGEPGGEPGLRLLQVDDNNGFGLDLVGEPALQSVPSPARPEQRLLRLLPPERERHVDAGLGAVELLPEEPDLLLERWYAKLLRPAGALAPAFGSSSTPGMRGPRPGLVIQAVMRLSIGWDEVAERFRNKLFVGQAPTTEMMLRLIAAVRAEPTLDGIARNVSLMSLLFYPEGAELAVAIMFSAPDGFCWIGETGFVVSFLSKELVSTDEVVVSEHEVVATIREYLARLVHPPAAP